jgi:hypothetical protein
MSGTDEDDALASTAIGGPRSPSQHALHGDVKKALFEGQPLPSTDYEPGTVIAGRYKVVALLGRGGMGEVYRARDLVVDQDVAIKFLPPRLAMRPGYLERFVHEVRLARQVSHPHVCRVHDIGEADGRSFISMEYIDGEDLASLLRRIGRLDHEKALELAHQLCAGLAALHERGMIHRDLKPSNVMLDGNGRIRLADFGLASVVDELGDHEIRDGTPAYQAPEQIGGREVTARSDVYALGLVLHEMFLGRRYDDSKPDSTSALSGLEAPVAEVLERCLDPDPRNRPASALEVSAQLPGGDPLAAALAAGRLPSPEAVANAATVGALSRTVGWALLVVTVVALVVIGLFGAKTTALNNTGAVLEPEVLEHRIGEILAVAGYETGSGGYAVYLEFDDEYIGAVAFEEDDPREVLRESGLSTVRMRMRGFPTVGTTGTTIRVDEIDLASQHETEVIVDGRGHLRELVRIPDEGLWERDGGTTGGDDGEIVTRDPRRRAVPAAPEIEPPLRSFAWSQLLDEAGLDQDSIISTTPIRRPPTYADTLRAWEATLGDDRLIVHGASLQGRPVWFMVERKSTDRPLSQSSMVVAMLFLVAGIVGVATIIATLRSAIEVLRRREGDFVGARRLAYVMFALQVLTWVLDAQAFEFMDVLSWLLLAAGYAIAAWLGYLILEPYARANWPRSLVSWTRALQGRFRDPMVGRDLLVAACVAAAVAALCPMVPTALGEDPLRTQYTLDALLGVRRALGVAAEDTRQALVLALSAYVSLLGLQAVFRVRIVALTLFVAVPPTALIASGSVPDGIELGLTLFAFAFVMARFGLFALVALNVMLAAATHFPITFIPNAWWGRTGLLGIAIVLAPAIYGFVRSTAKR